MTPHAYSSLAEVYEQGRYAPYTRAIRLGGASNVALIRFAQPAGEFPDPPTDDFTLAINERGGGRMRFDVGTGRRDLPFRRGDLVLKAPGVATEFGADRPHQKSFVSLPVSLVGRLAEETGTPGCRAGSFDFGALHDGVFRSAPVAALLELIWSEPAADGPHARLFNEGAVLALVATLLRLALPMAVPARAPAALPEARIARVRHFVEANLAESFGSADMAACIGLSAWHFSRAFKAATGQTPRAFVTALRIQRAKEMLSQGGLPLAHVAQACGFADQAHFSTVFRCTTGCTPGAWRRGLS
jgi:AraC family transcriptional regulator